MADTDLMTLFSRVRAGDKDAFGEVYQALKQPVYTICRRIVLSPELAEDVTHDVFVKLYISPPEPSVNNPRAWVFRMARNLAIDALRKQKLADGKDGEVTQDDLYGRVDLRLDLETAISHLPRDQREILSLHLNGGLNFQDIAGITDLSLPSVYRRYRRALKTLRDELNGGAI